MKVDKTLIQGCIKSQRKDQILLYKACFAQLFGICIRYKTNKQEAEAAFNVFFLKLLKNLNRLDSEKSFFPWARRVLINTLIDEYRKEIKAPKVEYHEPSKLVAINQRFSLNDGALELDADQIRKMVMELPKMTRIVFNLFAMDGYSHKEISEKMNMSIGTSKWHVSSARSQLQKRIMRGNAKLKMVKNG